MTEKGLVYFCYRKFFNNKDENIKGLCKLIDLCRNRMVFVFGMSGVIHQMQEMNEYTLKEKCVIRVVDVFKMLEKFDKGILGDIALFSVYDYSNSVEKSLNTLIRRYNCVYNENITEYIMRNCVKCFKIYKILCN